MKFNRTSTKQKGIGLVSFLLAMSLMTIVLMYVEKWESHRELSEYAKSIKTKIEFVINKSQQYYMGKMLSDSDAATTSSSFPTSYEKLTDGGYIDECSEDDELKNKCIRMNILPIGSGEELEFSVSLDKDGFAQLKLKFSLAGETNTQKKNLLKRYLLEIPGYSLDDDDEATITVSRPASALSFDNVVLRDGTHDMTGTTWDYGGTATLDNVVDMSFTDLTDRTAITSMVKNGSSYITSKSGVKVEKPSCPDGYNPTISTYFIGTGGSKEFTELGNFDTWYENTSSSYWTVKVRFAGLQTGDSSREWHYQGNVGYWTWCDL